MKKYPSAPALFCQEVLVLLIIKILLLSIVRDHDLVFSDIPKVIMTLPDLKFNACKIQILFKWCSEKPYA